MMGVTTAWMWATDSGGVNGVNIDLEAAHIRWFDDAAACACGGSSAVQSFEQFKQDGPAFGHLPQDILEELQSAVEQLEEQHFRK